MPSRSPTSFSTTSGCTPKKVNMLEILNRNILITGIQEFQENSNTMTVNWKQNKINRIQITGMVTK